MDELTKDIQDLERLREFLLQDNIDQITDNSVLEKWSALQAQSLLIMEENNKKNLNRGGVRKTSRR